MRALRTVLCALAGVACGFGTLPAAAQAYPDRPITLIVPFAPGGIGDIVGRELNATLTTTLGQPLVVENKAGAGTQIGTAYVVQSEPDGYTLAIQSSSLTILQNVRKDLGFDVTKDLVPVASTIAGTLGVIISPDVPANTLEEFIAYAKERPGELNFASGGVGSTTHLAAQYLLSLAGVDVQHIPYAGGAQAMEAVVAGDAQLIVIDPFLVKGQIDAGKARLLAVGSTERSPLLPDVPTVIEAGVPGYEVGFWWGVFAPQGTPPEIVERLNQEINKVFEKPESQARFRELGYSTHVMSPDAFRQMTLDEVEKWRKVVELSNLQGG